MVVCSEPKRLKSVDFDRFLATFEKWRFSIKKAHAAQVGTLFCVCQIWC